MTPAKGIIGKVNFSMVKRIIYRIQNNLIGRVDQTAKRQHGHVTHSWVGLSYLWMHVILEYFVINLQLVTLYLNHWIHATPFYQQKWY